MKVFWLTAETVEKICWTMETCIVVELECLNYLVLWLKDKLKL